MTLLITGGNSPLARAFAASYKDQPIRLIDTAFTEPMPPSSDRLAGDLRDPQFIAQAMEGVDAVLHLAPIYPPESDDLSTLDLSTRGTYVLSSAAAEKGIQRFVLGSTLDLFEKLPAHWKVTEGWRPRPQPLIEQLGPWTAELSVREFSREEAFQAICLRFGRIVEEEHAASRPYDPRWLHIEDAVAGIHCALNRELSSSNRGGWRVFHITAPGSAPKVRLGAAGRERFGYQPRHNFVQDTSNDLQATASNPSLSGNPLVPRSPIPSRTIRNVVLFGAGGPIASALASELAASYRLKRTDIRPFEEASQGPRQSEGAPLPAHLDPPHEWRVVDVTAPDAVMDACEGMDAVINLTVIREDPVEAFRVNTLGAYNIIRAAVAHGIRRVVQTGPHLVDLSPSSSYEWDFDIEADAPVRAGKGLYPHTKLLGQEIIRTFAEEYDLEVPVLLFCGFVDPETAANWNHIHSFSISWQDSARALRRALEVGSLPSPYEIVNINADLPQGRYSNRKAKRLLDWAPRDNFEFIWQR